MRSNDDDFAIEKTGEFVGLGLAGAAAALTSDPYITALVALFPTIGEMVMRSGTRRLSRLWAGYESASESTAAAQARFNENARNPNVEDATLEAFRKAQDALDPEVVFVIGRLLFEYSDGRKPDRFFRCMGNLLTEVSLGELVELADILAAAIADAASRHTAVIELEPEHNLHGRVGVAHTEDPSRLLHETSAGRVLLGMLERSGFGYFENPSGIGGTMTRFVFDTIAADRIVRLARI